jgi:N-acetylglucosamine malate deacetylase 2
MRGRKEDVMPDVLTICAVFAHPDDEAFGVAGTLAKYGAAGVRTVLICATRGEAGLANGLAASPRDLAGVRSAELACAAQVMGLVELVHLDFSDGGADGWDLYALCDQIKAVVQRERPAVVITFDENGVTRHPDHIAVHTVTRELVEAEGEALGVRRLFYQVVTCPEEASPEGPSFACVRPCDVDVTVDMTDFEPVKRAALICHRSQASDTEHLLGLPVGSLTEEHYRLAWADDHWRPAVGERDLLAGLGRGGMNW